MPNQKTGCASRDIYLNIELTINSYLSKQSIALDLECLHIGPDFILNTFRLENSNGIFWVLLTQYFETIQSRIL